MDNSTYLALYLANVAANEDGSVTWGDVALIVGVLLAIAIWLYFPRIIKWWENLNHVALAVALVVGMCFAFSQIPLFP